MAYEIYGSEFSHSIGTPIAGHNLYISNEFFQELPRGAVGELFISGSGVASGYLNRPDLTKQRFLPNPFLNVEGHDTVYRTGDLVRCLSNDTIEYIGRNDKQVQVHGTRIELGEIEQILVTYPGIVESVVLV
ncbi:SrfAC surfactin synthetase, partial [Pyrenochaeta sp. MPI-SDFR-AT-0127]